MNLLYSGAFEHRGGSFRAHMKSRVFISYSSRSAAAIAALDALRVALPIDGYTPFVDRWDLHPGDPWRRKILFALAGCIAGVVLLSNDTLEKRPGERHPWVLLEAGILSYRHELDPHFRLIPVLLEDVTLDDLQKAPYFSPLALHEIQAARAATPQELAQQVREVLGPASGRKGQRTLLQDVTEAFQSVLEDLDLSDSRLEKLALKLRSRKRTGWTREQCLSGIALILARLVLFDGAEGMKKFIAVLLEALGPNPTRRFLLLVHPLWVQAERAGRLLTLAPRPPLPPCAALTSGMDYFKFTAESHVHRAFWPRLAAYPAVINVDPGPHEKLLPLVSKSIDSYFITLCDSDIETHEQVMAYLEKVKPVLFVMLPKQWWPPSQKELKDLYKHYPTAIFLLHTGPKEPARLPLAVEPLPPVDKDEEEEAYYLREQANWQINRFAALLNS